MSTSEVVGKLLEQLRSRASLHVQRSKKLKDRLKPESAKNNVNNVVVRRRFTPRPLVSASSSDYFTRLVNSSPKPLVLRSVHHPVTNHLLKLSQSSNYRHVHIHRCIHMRSYRGLVLLSSLKLIKEYCSRNGPCHRIYTTSHSNKLLSDPGVKFDKVLIVSKKLLQKIGNLYSYKNGLVAEVPLPEPSSSLGVPRLVLAVCPSNKAKSRISGANLGTIIRSAQALEWQGVYVLKNDQIDLFDPLTIRSSQYSLSTLPYLKGTVSEIIEFIKSNNLLACHCANDGISVESDEFSDKLRSHCGLMLIIGHIPHELYTLSNKISVKSTHLSPSIDNGNSVGNSTDFSLSGDSISEPIGACSVKYSLDDQVQTGIAMYLIKKLYFKHVSASPFIMS
ncbi:uncharacterized protein TOT_040000611 [Theileria orientalis strain Shintoku]|uniref:tRNA/rRNA methyltransferase SpoU type domain-containing protein n=1 Tax=Theileria orientalis strain Shintoku TaxID=869250 RepID=J4C4I4_THEOR|nr:uncharacterized protein TOT_040000611 [Theileria orientalis strain Shintoku]BAM42241.1 uncharacterized protein TOT_040000611 [Theileria orientalis strain Shintoku]|eukprot:XP_009692542.1 uncharacterized protein TOT_040000611 [Theileria orientalis strain Shintoku]